MRTTVRIDDDLLMELRKLAAARKMSLSTILNDVLRRGLAPRTTYQQRVFSLGPSKVNLDKALAVADAWEDEEILRKFELGK